MDFSNTIFFSEKYAICNDTTSDGFNVWPYATQSSGSVRRMPIFAYHSSVTGDDKRAGQRQVPGHAHDQRSQTQPATATWPMPADVRIVVAIGRWLGSDGYFQYFRADLVAGSNTQRRRDAGLGLVVKSPIRYRIQGQVVRARPASTSTIFTGLSNRCCRDYSS